MLKTKEITILGRPYSKKNSRSFRQTGNAKYTVPGKNFMNFEVDAIRQLANTVKSDDKFGKELVYISYDFYKPGRDLQDVDNAICSINDVLQHKLINIIDDDKQILAGKFSIWPGSGMWKTVLTIRELYCKPGEHEFDTDTLECTICFLPKKARELFQTIMR